MEEKIQSKAEEELILEEATRISEENEKKWGRPVSFSLCMEIAKKRIAEKKEKGEL